MKKCFFIVCAISLIFTLFTLVQINNHVDIEVWPLTDIEIPPQLPISNDPSLNSILTEFDYMEISAKYVHNLPSPNYLLGKNKKGPKFLGNRSCASFPRISQLKFDNLIWQEQKQSNWTFYLFGAFWDIRPRNEEAPSIRIVGMMDRTEENITANYCQVWFDNAKEPLIREITQYKCLWPKRFGHYKNGELLPYLWNCPMPTNYNGPVPTSVSVVSSPCVNATNNLRVNFEKPEKKEKFAVCVKGLDLISPDWSTRLVEWIELLRILGVSKIYLYDLAVHPNVKRVYKYYSDLGTIEVFPLTLPGDVPNEPHLRHVYLKRKLTVKRQHELIPYHDCLYRAMYKYEYISFLDVDEVIIPHNEASTWTELANILEQQPAYSKATNSSPVFVFADVMFSPEDKNYGRKEQQNIPDYLFMLQHTHRSSKDAGKGRGIKCFYRSDLVVSAHNHFPTSCFGNCTRIYVKHSDGFLHHYRTKSAGGIVTRKKNEPVTLVVDETLWKWKDELILRSSKALKDLGFIS